MRECLHPLILLIWLVLSGSAHANPSFYNGTELYVDCTADRTKVESLVPFARCQAYIEGVVDSLLQYEKLDSQKSICLPSDVKLKAFEDSFVAWFRLNPKAGNFGAPLIIQEVLKKNFPCQ